MKIEYIFLAVASGMMGGIIIFFGILAALYFGINLLNNLWIIGLPVIVSILMNIFFIELYRKYKEKNHNKYYD